MPVRPWAADATISQSAPIEPDQNPSRVRKVKQLPQRGGLGNGCSGVVVCGAGSARWYSGCHGDHGDNQTLPTLLVLFLLMLLATCGL